MNENHSARARRKRFTALMLAVCVWIGLAGIGPAFARTGPVRSLAEIRTDSVVRQYWDLSCGAAVIATLLTFQHGLATSEREAAIGMMQRAEYVADPMLVRMRQGFSLLDMKRFVERRGLVGVGLGQLTLEDLKARAPIVVTLSQRGQNHFVIVRGFHGDRVLMADPNFGNRTMTIAQFERAWAAHERLGRVGFQVARDEGPSVQGALAVDAWDFVTLN